jgi:hypothetical protein
MSVFAADFWMFYAATGALKVILLDAYQGDIALLRWYAMSEQGNMFITLVLNPGKVRACRHVCCTIHALCLPSSARLTFCMSSSDSAHAAHMVRIFIQKKSSLIGACFAHARMHMLTAAFTHRNVFTSCLCREKFLSLPRLHAWHANFVVQHHKHGLRKNALTQLCSTRIAVHL